MLELKLMIQGNIRKSNEFPNCHRGKGYLEPNKLKSLKVAK